MGNAKEESKWDNKQVARLGESNENAWRKRRKRKDWECETMWVPTTMRN